MADDSECGYEACCEMIEDDLCMRTGAKHIWPVLIDNPWEDDFNTVYLYLEFGDGRYKQIGMDEDEMFEMLYDNYNKLIDKLTEDAKKAKMRIHLRE